MFHLVHPGKARQEQLACSTATAALGMQALEVSEVRTTAAPHRQRPKMYSRLPSSGSGASSRASKLLQLLAQAMLLSARCSFAATATLLLYWMLFVGPLHWRIEVGYLVPTAAKALYESKVLGSMLLRDLVFLWLLPAAMAVSAVVVLILQPVVKQQLGPSAPKALTGRWMSLLLPPRGWWAWLCGGITVQDLLLICLWAAINASWFTAALAYYQHKAALKAAANGLQHATGQQLVKALARSFGATLAPNLVLLFYPVSRGSAVPQALGISYPAGIRYHRWLGFGVLTLVAAHGLTYHAVWLASGEWVDKALDQGSGHNNLLGSVAFIFALALWITSLETIRRNQYGVFKAVHHAGFWGFLVLGVCHKWDLIWGFLPGLLMYGIDAVYRTYQAVLEADSCAAHGSTTRVLHASVSPHGGMCTLVLSCPRFAAAASGYVWLSVPSLSRQHHPFEYVAVPWPAADPTGTIGPATPALLLHIKAYSRFTKQLLSLVVAKGEKMTVKIQGPYAELPGPVLGHRGVASAISSCASDGIVIVAGGNGIASAAGVFLELAAAAVAPGLPCLLVWTSRSAEELEVMGPMVLAMAKALQLQLTVKLYYTGIQIPPAAAAASVRELLQDTRLLLDAHSEHAALLVADAANLKTVAVAPVLPNGTTAGSLLASSPHHIEKPHLLKLDRLVSSSSSSADQATSSLCPVVALGSWWGQAGHKLAMHLAVFAGAFCALALGQCIQDTQTAALGSRWPTAKAGATYTALLVAFILIPGSVTLWATLLFMEFQHKHAKRNAMHSSSSSSSSSSLCHVDAEIAIAECFGEPRTSVSAVAATAAAAACSGNGFRLATTATGCLQLQPSAVQKLCEGSCTGSTTASTLAHEAVLQLQQTAESAAWPNSRLILVECGRPPLQQLVKGWLATLQQLATHKHSSCHLTSSASQQQCCTVYAMGPEQLVQNVQQLCADVACLRFVRKTHQL